VSVCRELQQLITLTAMSLSVKYIRRNLCSVRAQCAVCVLSILLGLDLFLLSVMHACCVMYSKCVMCAWWHWELSRRVTAAFLQCFDTAGWVIIPVKISSPKWPKLYRGLYIFHQTSRCSRWTAIAWLTRYVACAVNCNRITLLNINSTGLPRLGAASQLT